MDDVEREGGNLVENACMSADGDGEDTGEKGVGSLATFVMGGAMGGDSGEATAADADAGVGAGAVAVRVGSGTEVALDADTAPVSRETSLSEMALPEKNSPAEREGSIDGAGGKMSDWNVSDCACVGELVSAV